MSYEAVDRDLPALLESERPDALIMFGLAARTKHVRIETRARNALTRACLMWKAISPSAAHRGWRTGGVAAAYAAQRLLMAVRSTGLPVAISRDAGHYLCNYLCWRAAEAGRNGAPRITSFIHVPVGRQHAHGSRRPSLDDLAALGCNIVRTVIAASHAFA